MHISHYPEAIANTEGKLFRATREVEAQAELLGELDAQFEAAIAFDPDLKNDAQRKAKRLEFQQSPDYEYQEIKAALKVAKEEKEQVAIELNLLRNQFSVAKLTLKFQIAQMEAVAA